MATGFEALGAASAVLQVISFSCSVASLCYDIYDGKPTIEHGLEDYASRMIEAAGHVQTRCQMISHATDAEKRLAEIGLKCQSAAQALEKEVHTTTDAIELKQRRGFQNLGDDVRALVSQIADGHTKTEELIKTEQNTTRDLLIREAVRTREDNAQVVSEVQAMGVRAATDAQRERLLKSLKADIMNQRYHDVMCSSAATFERVFLSYNHTVLQDYDNWQPTHREVLDVSDGELVIDDYGLDMTTVMVQEIDQRCIKGLLCSLIHRILRESSRAIDQVLHRFKNSSSMDSYHDWSNKKLEKVLFVLLDDNDHPVCIFIDGLDEISDQDGYFKLLALVERLNTRDHVKVCVSSRPETQLRQRFQAIGATSIRLEDLTRPEMKAYVHKEIQPFRKGGKMSSSLLNKLTSGLLCKAEGVFLWLFLATRSLINGIQNCDDEETLLRRLAELPGELEELYENMWKRLNGNDSVYRKTAARSLADLKMLCETTANNISTRCAGLLQLRNGIIQLSGNIASPPEFNFLVQHVEFIHRTAHDFFVETQAGQDILNYKHAPSLSVNTDVALVNSILYMARVFHMEFNGDLIVSSFDPTLPNRVDLHSLINDPAFAKQFDYKTEFDVLDKEGQWLIEPMPET
ncbi:hypothetical protein G7Z17_g3025 [Cylindrodendrum hubeiense]|uniref:Fungal N-terminal domain-containing protein n=1 Tax=Cylindrodendrum hubeiense TaxID=595255 RepID=A0A9P5HBM5_9HYPO|nr:hypothetical protein G7Z17_g3025 [Cylindrodendrum hubeiense]